MLIVRVKGFIAALLFMLSLHGCTQIFEQQAEKTSPWIQFPYLSVDSAWISKGEFTLQMTDSTGYYNPTLVQQYIIIHALQSEPPLDSITGMKFLVNIPDRDPPTLDFYLSVPQYQVIQDGYSNKAFRNFIRELLKLNYETASKYRGNMSSLIDRTNMIFAQQIEMKFKNFFPDNSTWTGYNSFRIFGIYFEECTKKQHGVGHDLIAALNDKSAFQILPEDMEKLQLLIAKYEKMIT